MLFEQWQKSKGIKDKDGKPIEYLSSLQTYRINVAGLQPFLCDIKELYLGNNDIPKYLLGSLALL